MAIFMQVARGKSHRKATLKSTTKEGNSLKKVGPELTEGELLLQVLNGFILVVTAGGTVFYASSNIQDYLGFNQSDVIHQSAYDLIHTEDRGDFQRQLHWALNPTAPLDTGQLVTASDESARPLTCYDPDALPPENSAFLERSFVCRLRCLLDDSSGFIALNLQGHLKFLHGQNERAKDGTPVPPQLALFALATPLQPPSILEIRTKNLIFRSKHKLDFTPTDCDARGKMALGYTEAELCERGSGYQFIHAADMLHCAENHMRLMKTGESGLTVFRLLTKNSGWMWVQANARLVYKNGQPDCIIASQIVLTEEEGKEDLRKRTLERPFCFTTGEAVLYDTAFPKTLEDSFPGDSGAPPSDNLDSPPPKPLDPDSLLGSLLKQDESIYVCVATDNQPAPAPSPQEEPAALPEEGSGGIFSSRWQESVLSLPEMALFKREPQGIPSGDGMDGELWRFMRTLGVGREDLELFQQDDLFLDVDLGGRDGRPDATDEILTYVQQSLGRSDCVLSYSARGGDLDPSFACLEQQIPMQLNQLSGEQPSAKHPQPSPDPQWRPQKSQPLMVHQPLDQYQQYQARPQKLKSPLNTPHQGLRLPRPPLSGRGSAEGLSSQPIPSQPLGHRLMHMQVSEGHSQSQQAGSASHSLEIPPLFQPGLLRPSQPHHQHLCLGEPTTGLPLNNQLNTVSVSRPPQPSTWVAPGVGDVSPLDLEELLSSLDSGQPLGQDGGEACWGLEARSVYQLHLTDPHLSSLGPAAYGHPQVLGLVRGTEQPFLIQNGSRGILQESRPASPTEGDWTARAAKAPGPC
ncbi:aryl hydrocarbon receptor 1a isoform X2 [Hypomesus transpacificus]|uniref:aryl hydrocarbon receptor 1a isoform X2 n=1 Tax=Hypomesus transpacificus TaxID=137520 RepID=UPI001F076B57|nr:aryl hydrocarbon receptor 1a isoform X2 [Hypomesus transpacificus]